MVDEAQKIIAALRHLGTPLDIAEADCGSCPMQDFPHEEVGCGESCPGVLMLIAADLIEELSANLEAAKEREKGLSILLTSAQSAAETYKRERDAAVADMKIGAESFMCDVCAEHESDNGYGVGRCVHSKDHECFFEWRGLKDDA